MVLEDKYELTYVHNWVVSQVQDTQFWFISIQSLQPNTLSFKAQEVFSSLTRYIIVPQWWAQLPELTFPRKSKLMGHQRLNPGVHFEQHNLLQNISSELWTPPYPSKKGCQLDAQPSSTDLPLPQEAQAALISHLRNHYLLMPHFHIYQHIPIALSTI